MARNVLFIIGGGPRVGHSVAKKFLKEGYQVAIGRRNIQETAKAKGLEGVVPVYTDISKPESVEAAFREVESKLGTPNVVVYNGGALTMPTDYNDPFSVSTKAYEDDLAVNVSSGYAGLHRAVHGFQVLKANSKDGGPPPCVYIATGNVTPFMQLPVAVTLGSGKSALAYLISIGAVAYKAAGFRFYFASEVTSDGGPVPYPDVSGEAHGDAYWKLVNGGIDLEKWDLRFVATSDGTATEKEAV